MQELLNNLNLIQPAIVDSSEIDLECIGKFGRGLNTLSNKSQFLSHLHQQCQKALYLYTPCPDPRPRLMHFNSLKEASSPKDSIPQNSYSRCNFIGGKELLYKCYNSDNKLVRSTLENAGFKYTDAHLWNILWIGKSAQAYLYDDLNPFQRINHFPNSYEITRKDKMCLNLQLMKSKFPGDYDFFPDTYIIPKDIGDFSLRYYSENCQWIVKPCNSSQGKGIFILDSLNSLSLDDGCIVSKYIADPLLVNDLKCDLRLYLLITSFEPLKLYIYEEGLARFACDSYTSEDSSNKFAYLTNYSINKKNEKFIQNTDWHEDNVGHKWSFSAFIRELTKLGYDTDKITKNIYDLIIKTIIAIEGLVVDSVRKLALKHNNCFDLLGFDIMIDENLKPWLLEVNLSPSMNTDTPLDLHIKSNLIADTLNIIGIRAFDRKTECSSKIQSRIKAKQNSTKGKSEAKRGEFKSSLDDTKYRSLYLETLEETLRMGNFIRIFPFKGCEIYDKLFKVPRKANKIMYNFLFSEVLKDESVFPGISPSITEDDVILEYLARVIKTYKLIELKKNEKWDRLIEKLANHVGLAQESNLQRIQKYIVSKTAICKLRNEKASLLKTFTPGQLENMIKSMNKDIVQHLFDENFTGILTCMLTIEKPLSKPKTFRFLKIKAL